MGRFIRRNKNGYGAHEVYRLDRNKNYNKKKMDFIGTNDKLKMLGILFIAGFRASESKGASPKSIKIFLYENKENVYYYDKKKYERVYLSILIYINLFINEGRISIYKEKEMERKKSQIVRV